MDERRLSGIGSAYDGGDSPGGNLDGEVAKNLCGAATDRHVFESYHMRLLDLFLRCEPAASGVRHLPFARGRDLLGTLLLHELDAISIWIFDEGDDVFAVALRARRTPYYDEPGGLMRCDKMVYRDRILSHLYKYHASGFLKSASIRSDDDDEEV
jgi:hypothetical protein